MYAEKGHLMDLSNPAILYSGILISAFGLGLFLYGRKATDMPFLVSGLVLSVLPLMAHSLLVLWGITGICGSALYVIRRMG